MKWSGANPKGEGYRIPLPTCLTETTRHLPITDFRRIKNSTFKSPFSALPLQIETRRISALIVSIFEFTTMPYDSL